MFFIIILVLILEFANVIEYSLVTSHLHASSITIIWEVNLHFVRFEKVTYKTW